ncbi:NAD(P)-dependent oxidoreductase [Salinimicrobium soli]|uniref:NAD(P)-dependent oxidoreductase n=1 Tax=Salinimicrobium soli TaxID=1254399 RepID=UPI003AAF41B9
MKIGWIGLGKMGKPMSESLLKAGRTVIVYNRTKDKEEPLKEDGADTAASPKELIEKVDVVFLMISDDKAVEDVFYGDKGILAAEVSGKIVVNMSTVSAEVSRKVASALESKGNDYLDAPVSGSVKQAQDATLVVIAGGKGEVFEEVSPLLETIGKKAILVGDIGVGNLTKLAVNTFLGIVTQGLAEVINFSREKEVKTSDLMEIINNSALGSPFIKIKGNAVLEEDYNAAFTLSHLTKDLRLAQEAGFDAPLGNAAYETFSKAEAELGGEDVISIIKKLK